ncbi:hypothetical protein SNEBB_010261 [Seison nebaliae]|nr:hypothetical protein SNEBB_010261 [Seison nebaliae]
MCSEVKFLKSSYCHDRDDWPSIDLNEVDDITLHKYVQQLIRKDRKNIDNIITYPDTESLLNKISLNTWKYEHIRQVIIELNFLVSRLSDECTAEQCDKMSAGNNWVFLCAAHEQPMKCNANNYICHTLDHASSILMNPKYFPSKIHMKNSSINRLSSIARRLYRIFAHTYYHHRRQFDDFEQLTHLCERFTKFILLYSVVPHDVLIIPLFHQIQDNYSMNGEREEGGNADTSICDDENDENKSKPIPTTTITTTATTIDNVENGESVEKMDEEMRE